MASRCSLGSPVTSRAQLERYPQTEFDLSSVERIECAGDLAEGAIGHIGINPAQISMIEYVQEIEAQLQVALFAKPGQVVIFEDACIHLDHTGVAVDIPRLSSL